MTLCVSLYRFLFGGLGLWRAGREVHFVDGTRRAFGGALAAHFALFKVDVSHIVLNRDGLKRAHLRALAAADAGCRAGLAGHCALVFVHARNKQAAVFLAAVTQFDDSLRTRLDARTAGHALKLQLVSPADRVAAKAHDWAPS